ncbi:probable RNA-binding protein 46 [Copidosoma floridanum]|uniref:probable RNA-binding protein 46 n=1 Tax=Copidosoma floridanum TaxID=29053 RepID=UPI0006C9D771|nr:probable RNA-binding protein 46 [Copidosoma floridanum]
MWQQEFPNNDLLEEFERLHLDDDDLNKDVIRKRIPRISPKSVYFQKKVFPEINSHKSNKEIVKSNYSQDSLEDQITTIQNVLKLQHQLGVEIVQKNGQRKLGGPPPGWTGPPPGEGCEIFVGKIPRNIYEDKIYPLFSKVGEIYEMRLMMHFSGNNRGYCFIMYTSRESAEQAVKLLNNYEIAPGSCIGVIKSLNNCRLHVTELPAHVDVKTLTKRLWEHCDEIDSVSMYTYLNNPRRKDVLIRFKTHRGAAMARRRMIPERNLLFDKSDVRVDWADPKTIFKNVTSPIKKNETRESAVSKINNNKVSKHSHVILAKQRNNESCLLTG